MNKTLQSLLTEYRMAGTSFEPFVQHFDARLEALEQSERNEGGKEQAPLDTPILDIFRACYDYTGVEIPPKAQEYLAERFESHWRNELH